MAPQAGHSVPGLAAGANGVARVAAVRSRYASASTAGRMIDAGVFSTPASRSRLEEPGLPHPRQLKMRNPVRKDVSDSD